MVIMILHISVCPIKEGVVFLLRVSILQENSSLMASRKLYNTLAKKNAVNFYSFSLHLELHVVCNFVSVKKYWNLFCL